MTLNAFTLSLVGMNLFFAVMCWRHIGPKRSILKHEALEFSWTMFPIVSVFWITSHSFYVLYATSEVPDKSRFVNVITGHQWFWTYKYATPLKLPGADPANQMYEFSDFEHDSYALLYDLKEGLEDDGALSYGDMYLLSVDAPFIVPAQCYGELLVTSDDVIHSWSVPALGITMDGVPGRINRATLTTPHSGVAYGHCREICGVGHHMMPIVVEVISVESYLKFTTMHSSLEL
nr:cytochrome c oxidase subunit 2 [Glottidia pyramidata]